MDEDRLDLISRKLDEILNKFDALIKLRVMEMTTGKTKSEQIWLFAIAGLSPKKIAETIGTSSNAVRVALSNLRRIKKQGHGRQGTR